VGSPNHGHGCDLNRFEWSLLLGIPSVAILGGVFALVLLPRLREFVVGLFWGIPTGIAGAYWERAPTLMTVVVMVFVVALVCLSVLRRWRWIAWILGVVFGLYLLLVVSIFTLIGQGGS
jgi:hypothetical protein